MTPFVFSPYVMTTLIALGVGTGIASGLFGIGGGIILVPVLIFLFQFTPQTASGLSLVALLFPVGIFGVLEYYRSGKISPDHIKMGLLISLGMFLGTFLGARLAARLSTLVLQRIFSIFLVLVALRLWIFAR